jgi:hypothetical protein
MKFHSITRFPFLVWFAVFPATGFAVTIDVTVNAGPSSDTQTATSGSLTATVNSGTSYAIATGSINDAGWMAVQTIGDGSNYSADATTTYSRTFTNTSASTLGYNVDFLVTGGLLASDNNFGNTSTDWTLANYYAYITKGGSTLLWGSSGSLSRPIGGVASFSEMGTSLGGVFSSGPSAAGYLWNNYYDTVSFQLAPGASTVFQYVMSVDTQGNVTCPSFFGSCYSSSFGSRIGDPFSVGAPLITNITTTVVPVPAAIWLFGSGLIGLIGAARRKART